MQNEICIVYTECQHERPEFIVKSTTNAEAQGEIANYILHSALGLSYFVIRVCEFCRCELFIDAYASAQLRTLAWNCARSEASLSQFVFLII